MIKYRSGNILEEGAEALVNTVNCVGVMGRGIALQFRKAFPGNFKVYAEACKRRLVKPGKMFLYETGQSVHPRYIINFPTKRHWRGGSHMEDIDAGLKDLVEVIRTRNIRSIALPPLGCGLGGLDWNEVRSHIEDVMAILEDVQIIVYKPSDAPIADTEHVQGVLRMTAGRAALVTLMRRYLNGLLDPSISLLEVHKLMYFLQEAGEPLHLKYQKAYYGPYAENLRHVLSAIEGSLVSGYDDGGDEPYKELELMPGAVEDAEDFLDGHEHTLARFDRVSNLVDGFESPVGLELLSTVHWVFKEEGARSRIDIVEQVHGWSKHKRQFTERQIGLAIRVLEQKGWMDLGK